ncbi:hypothetical protein [Actinoallomurus iriomotensis]|uniref:hypothetical protein n=1 Tax=Actinoallomurus TaxID=667113 RepID=UPI002555B891|nr:hypothetical protein [Actinoallomurus iriomotensis]
MCLDSTVQGNTKFVSLTRNNQVFVAQVDLTPTPVSQGFQNATSALTQPPFQNFVPVCATVTVQGNNLHITALGADNSVIQTACTINPLPIQFPADCSVPIVVGSTPALQRAFARSLLAGQRALGRGEVGSFATGRRHRLADAPSNEAAEGNGLAVRHSQLW